MVAHITYLSEQRADPQIRPAPARGQARLFDDMFEVESYLRHQGSTFIRRFDANSI